MHVLILYNSRTGHTQQAAEAIAQAVRDLDHDSIVKSVSQIHKDDIEQADLLIVGTWVHGLILFRVRPAGADLWVPSLPSLDSKPVGVFCTYAFHPRNSLSTLGDMLREKRAKIVGQRAFHRSRPDKGVEAFVTDILQSAQQAQA